MGFAERIAQTQMHELQCGECGIVFWVPGHWYDARAVKGENEGRFCCPNGHHRKFTEPEVNRLEKELKDERERRWQIQMELGQERVKLEKLQKRFKQGVCPYCKRTFQNVVRHMTCKHKEKP